MAQDKINAAFAEYCRQYKDNHIAMDVLERFLEDRPVFQPPLDLLPVDEYQLRVDIVAQIEKRLRSGRQEFRINAAVFSLLMITPLHILKKLGQIQVGNIFYCCVINLYGHIVTMGPIKAISSEADSAEATRPGKRPWLQYEPGSATGPAHKRIRSEGSGSRRVNVSSSVHGNKSQVTKCEQRDGHRCVVTKTDCPQVCHIVPLCWRGSNGEEVMDRLCDGMTAQYLLGWDRLDGDLKNRLICGESDKSWNMICLSPSLHAWWGKCYFGLKYLGSTPCDAAKVRVTLEFRWLQQNKHTKASHILDEQQQRDFRDELLRAPHPAVAANVCSSNRPILSGQTVDVTLDESDAPKFIGVIKIQWAMVQLAAMSGGAEPNDRPLPRRDRDVSFSSALYWIGLREISPFDVAEWASKVPPGLAPPGQDETRARRDYDDYDDNDDYYYDDDDDTHSRRGDETVR
ncbi:hypothetical protein G6O67_001506 [Ophiocordyceps sinensis]|uniref:HNH nuclease domain-containing protein n=1 Tax=Ophiocordyceps sinensis TaxID=72228 RepID=A0A8H4PXS9_9HYPO|nr:hypothetical protein G6O67_001506 [Ophiocordyceps sinensis]